MSNATPGTMGGTTGGSKGRRKATGFSTTGIDDHDQFECGYWTAVDRILGEVFGATDTACAELRADIMVMPWADRKLFYNAEPVEIAAELAGVPLSEEQRHRGRAVAASLRDAEANTPKTTRRNKVARNATRTPSKTRAESVRPRASLGFIDPLGDLLTRIRNGQRARMASVDSPASKLRATVLEVLKREGYIRSYFKKELRPGVNCFQIELKYQDGEPVIRHIKRVSKPGRRIYSKTVKQSEDISELGITILSTPKGIMSDKEAREARLDGEVLVQVF